MLNTISINKNRCLLLNSKRTCLLCAHVWRLCRAFFPPWQGTLEKTITPDNSFGWSYVYELHSSSPLHARLVGRSRCECKTGQLGAVMNGASEFLFAIQLSHYPDLHLFPADWQCLAPLILTMVRHHLMWWSLQAMMALLLCLHSLRLPEEKGSLR